MIKTALLATALFALPADKVQFDKRADVCETDMALGYALAQIYDRIQRDKYQTVPWRVFVVIREFQRGGFVVTEHIRGATCEGDRWLYGDSPDDRTVPPNFAPQPAPVFDTTG